VVCCNSWQIFKFKQKSSTVEVFPPATRLTPYWTSPYPNCSSSVVGRPVCVEENLFLCLRESFPVDFICFTRASKFILSNGFHASAQLKFRCFTIIFLT
jgi:hypothetical protein